MRLPYDTRRHPTAAYGSNPKVLAPDLLSSCLLRNPVGVLHSRRAKESETWKLVSNLTRDWPNLISPTRWLSCVVWNSCRRVCVLARGKAMLFRIFFLSASLLAIALAISTSNPFLSRAKLLRKHGYHGWVQFRPPACALSFTPASGIKWHIANTPKSQLVQPSTQKYESHFGLSWNSTWDIIKNMHEKHTHKNWPGEVGASEFVDTFLETPKRPLQNQKHSIWTGNSQAYKIQTLNPTFAGAWGTRRFYKIQIMEIHLLYIGAKNLVHIHPQKLSQKQLHFVKKPLFWL